jgi:putative transposase
MKKHFTEQQIIGFLKEAEAGMPVKELCRKHGFSDASFYTWRAKFAGMEVSDTRRLKDLEAANARLKKLLAEAMLDMEALMARLVELAHQRRRFGYRRLHALVEREGMHANHKRVYRLYREAGLTVRRRRKRHGVMIEREQLALPNAPNEVWSIDFVMDTLANGRRLKCLTIVDDFTKEAVDIVVDHGISGLYVARALDRSAHFRGYPKAVRTDQGA